MKESDRQAVFQQAFDYLTGRSLLNPKWPPWNLDDIDQFWALQWEPQPAKPPPRP